MSQRALSRRQFRFFHASPEDLEPGTEIVPGAERGVQHFPHASNHSVYMSDDYEDSHPWALHIAQNTGKPTHVYRVKPVGEVRSQSSEMGGNEHLAPKAVVGEKIDTVHPDDEPLYG